MRDCVTEYKKAGCLLSCDSDGDTLIKAENGKENGPTSGSESKIEQNHFLSFCLAHVLMLLCFCICRV